MPDEKAVKSKLQSSLTLRERYSRRIVNAISPGRFNRRHRSRQCLHQRGGRRLPELRAIATVVLAKSEKEWHIALPVSDIAAQP
jgi:hypothetical protein